MEYGQRNEVVGASDRALTLRIDGREETVPWSIVTGVSAGRAKLDRISEHWVLVLALDTVLRGEERAFIVGEIEPVWVSLTASLPLALPDVAPFEVWGAEVVTGSAPIELYQRSASL